MPFFWKLKRIGFDLHTISVLLPLLELLRNTVSLLFRINSISLMSREWLPKASEPKALAGRLSKRCWKSTRSASGSLINDLCMTTTRCLHTYQLLWQSGTNRTTWTILVCMWLNADSQQKWNTLSSILMFCDRQGESRGKSPRFFGNS